MYCIPKKYLQEFFKFPLVLVVLIVESINSLSPLPRGRRHVGRTSLNLCVDCFSLLVAVPVALVVSPAASSLRQEGGFLKGGCVFSSDPAAHNNILLYIRLKLMAREITTDLSPFSLI